MSNTAIRILPETSRTLGFAAISAAYAGIGTSFLNPVHLFMLQNLTDKLLMFSWDGVNDHFPLPSNGYVIMDITSNKTLTGGAFMIAQGTRFYVRSTASGVPTSGDVYLAVFYGFGG